ATIITARTDIETLISKMYDSSISEFNEFGNTIRQWKQEIIISFNLIEERIYKQDPKTGKTVAETKWRKANNAIAENRNKVIKQLKHNANGFHNWERFRTRALYVLNDDATYRIFATKL
ncbi:MULTISPECIES: transposase, partial [unclassified Breznakia]